MRSDFPYWQTVYYYFNKWTKNGTFVLIMNELVKEKRVSQGRLPFASRAAIDSQSVRKGLFCKYDTGIDGGKLVNGRKRHLLVDSLGYPLAVHVAAANQQDGIAGIELLWKADAVSANLKLICADYAYQGEFVKASACCGFAVEITQKPPSSKGFIPQKGRWQVERAFAWLNRYRRLSRDYEKLARSAQTFIQMAFCDLILAKI